MLYAEVGDIIIIDDPWDGYQPCSGKVVGKMRVSPPPAHISVNSYTIDSYAPPYIYEQDILAVIKPDKYVFIGSPIPTNWSSSWEEVLSEICPGYRTA